MNLADLVQAAAARHGDRPALVDVATGRTLDYATLDRQIDDIGRRLRAEGIEPAQRIALLGGNSIDYVAVAFGILAAGGCVVPVASGQRPDEVERILAAMDVNAVVCIGGNTGGWSFTWHARGAGPPDGFAALGPAFVRFSSGTTADAKGVVLSNRATAARVAAADAVLHFTPEDRIFWTLPLAYHFATTITAYLRAGSAILLCGASRPGPMLAAVRAARPTVLYASPIQLGRLSAAPGATRLGGVRLALSTAAPISAATRGRFEAVFGLPVGQAYGVIEAGLVCINTRGDGAPGDSVGRAVPGYAVEVVGDDGRHRGPGLPGEVVVRGPGLFDAYYAPWRPHAPGTWFHTGDEGVVDQSGALTLLGRRKSLIMVAGQKFFPEEVEACLEAFAEIAEARVFPVPHAHIGEVPHAQVVLVSGVPSLDRARLAGHCATRLSPHKVPVEVTVVTALPRTFSGKRLRRSG